MWTVERDDGWTGTETGRSCQGSSGMGPHASQGQVMYQYLVVGGPIHYYIDKLLLLFNSSIEVMTKGIVWFRNPH